LSGEKKYFAVLLPMLDAAKSAEHRQAHLDYLTKLREEGKIFAQGRFTDDWGGMVIYIAESYEQVQSWVQNDPYVIQQARTHEIHEWAMLKGNLEG
jgi:uncharacterized protein